MISLNDRTLTNLKFAVISEIIKQLADVLFQNILFKVFLFFPCRNSFRWKNPLKSAEFLFQLAGIKKILVRSVDSCKLIN